MLEPYIADYLHFLRFEKRASDHTCVAYKQDLNQFAAYLAEAYSDLEFLQSIELSHVRSWMAHMAENKMQGLSLQRKSSSLKSFFKYLIKKGILQQNPAALVSTPRTPKRLPVYLEQKDMVKVRHKQPEKETDELKMATSELVFELLYQTGMRRSELCNLKESDIGYSRMEIKVLGKRNKERLIPVSSELLAEISGYLSLKKKLFNLQAPELLVNKAGKPLQPHNIYSIVKELLCSTNLSKKSPHVLRHTFATQLSNNGAELNAIKDLLGHSSLAATQIYTHNNIEKLKQQYRKARPKS